MNERQSEPKKPTRRVPGLIEAPTLPRPIPCLVRDMSASGASVDVANIQDVPDTIVLIVGQADMRLRCKVVWRRGSGLGLQFDE